MKISFGEVKEGRQIIAAKIFKQKQLGKFTVIDVGGTAIGWSLFIADAFVDINKSSTDKLQFVFDLCKESGWKEILEYVEVNGKFDYAICTHTLEDIYNPYLVLDNLPKIAKAGIISMPSIKAEINLIETENWSGFLHHRYLFGHENGRMVIAPKLPVIEKLKNKQIQKINEEIRFEWSEDIPYDVFMNNYLGPTSETVLNNLENFIMLQIKSNDTIKQLHLSKTGKVSDKWSSYIELYDKLFLEFKDRPINLFEIGIQNGGSLETWASYFQAAKNIIGCDIDPRCNDLRFADPRIKLIVSDINSRFTYEQVTKICSELDIVIDDGSHRSTDILSAFGQYFPMVVPGGLYVIEDTHTLYWNDWGNELDNKFNAYIFFKKVIDVMNWQFWEKEMDIEKYFSDFFPPNSLPDFITKGWIESVEFRNSVIIVRKAVNPTVHAVGKRWVTGTESLVNHNVIHDHQP